MGSSNTKCAEAKNPLKCKMQSIFDVADRDQNGVISIKEFNNILREINEEPSEDDEESVEFLALH